MRGRKNERAPSAMPGEGGSGVDGPLGRQDGRKIEQENRSVQRPDLGEVRRFLSLLAPDGSLLTFQTFSDAKDAKDENGRDPLAGVIHGSIDERWRTLSELNARGAGIFVTVNQTDGRGRTARNVVRVRAYFVDLDKAPLEPVLSDPRPPHIVVESSPGKYHAYWLVAGAPLDERDFKARQKRLIEQFGGDTSVHDLPRVLRLPGFLHQKGKPFLSRVIRSGDHAPYSPDAFPPLEEKPRRGKTKERARGTGTEEDDHAPITDEMIEAAVGVIPNRANTDRHEWIKVGMAIHEATGGSDWGFDLFDRWSAKWPGGRDEDDVYDEARTRKAWESFKPRDVTAATLLWLADQADQDWRRRLERERARRSEQSRLNADIGDEKVEPQLPTIMTIPEMTKRLVYIGSSGAVVDRLTGRVRKKEQAPGEYAASIYVPREPEPEKDDEGEGEDKDKGKDKKRGRGRPRTKGISCLAAWIKSADRLSVDALAWVPGEGEFCKVPERLDGHETAINLWRGLTPIPHPEDWLERVNPFLDHVAYLVPIESERRRFLQWLAHIVQHPEVLPHTCYLMVTKTTGIGRNLLASILVRALRGHVAAGVSLTELLSGGFNGRLSQKLLATVDEAQEGPSSQRYQRESGLRSMITEEIRRINPKYGLQSIEKNCLRWLMFSNVLDALPFANGDRRIIVIENPTVCREASYYTRLYEMTNDDPLFIGSVRRYLETLDLSDFNPGERAPMNAAKEKALAAMKSDGDTAIDDFRHSCFDENGVCVRPLVSRRDIVDALRPQGSTANATSINHAINRAGMINTGRRVRDKWGSQHGVIIVDETQWTVEMVKEAAGEVLLKVIGHGPDQVGGRGLDPRRI